MPSQRWHFYLLLNLLMDSNWTEWIGSIAGFLTTTSFIPQAYKV
jgi:hypothetical protein